MEVRIKELMFKDCFVDVKELGGKDNLCLKIVLWKRTCFVDVKELGGKDNLCLKIVLWM